MSKLKLIESAYTKLHDAIMEKFEEACREEGKEIPNKVSQKYGFSPFKSNLPNLQTHIANDEEFKSCCRNNGIEIKNNIGKYLYKKYLEANKANQSSITLSGVIYTEALFKYIGYNGVNDFLQKNNEEVSKSQISIREKEDIEEWTEYVGYLCSTKLNSEYEPKSRGIVSYNLGINFAKEQKSVVDNNTTIYDAKMQINSSVYEGIIFTGTATLYLDNFSIQLTSNEQRHFHFMFSIGAGSILPYRRKMLRGVYMTISGTGGVVSSETMITKRDYLTDEVKLMLIQYLRSNHYQIRASQVFYIKDLKNPKDGNESLTELIGTYYWLDMDRVGFLKVNKFVVEKDLSSYSVNKHSAYRIYSAFIEMQNDFLHIQFDKNLDRNENRGQTVLYAITQKYYPENLQAPFFKGEEVYSGGDRPTSTRVALIKVEGDIAEEDIGRLNLNKLKYLIEQDSRFKEAFIYILKMEEKDMKKHTVVESERQKYEALLK